MVAVGAAAVGGAALYVTGAFGPEPADPVASSPQEQVADPVATPSPQPAAEAPKPEPEAQEATPVATAEPATPEPEAAPEPAAEAQDEVETAALAPEPAPQTTPEATEAVPEAPAAKPAPEPETETEEQAETPAEPAPEVETVTLAAPSFDVVRVEPDGTTVIAGSATEGSRVTVFVDGVSQDSFDILPGGQFVSFLSISVSDAPRVLTLQAQLDQQVMASADSIILAPSPRAPEPETAIASAAPEPVAEPVTQEVETAAVQEEPTPAPATQTAAAPEEEAETAPAKVETPVAEAPVKTTTEQSTPKAKPEQVASAPAEPVAAPKEQAETVEEVATETAAASEPAATEPAAEPVAKDEQVATAQTGEDAATDEPATQEPAAEPVVQTQAPAEQAAPEPAQPTAVAVLRAGADGVELIQPATPQPAETQGKVTLDTISYSETGDVVLAGRGAPQAVVRTYLNNQAVADFAVAQDSRWRGELMDIKPGIYTLRLDELDLAGKILSRLETPFKREAPEVLRPATQPATQVASAEQSTAAPAPVIRAVTVQKGDTLWAISQDRYGEGLLYVRVFEANRQAIRDPDLIYPGQVFTIPE